MTGSPRKPLEVHDPVHDPFNPAASALIDATAALRRVDWQHYLDTRPLSQPAERAARAALELIAAVDDPGLIR